MSSLTTGKHQRWTMLKKKVESLWAPHLDMQIHANYYKTPRTERWWIVLNGEIIWDFPGPFIGYNRLTPAGARLPMISYYGDMTTHAAHNILDPYCDLSAADLLNHTFDHDHWELSDILRAADRRLGRKRLIEWALTLDPDNPAIKVMNARFPWKEKASA